MRQGLRAKALGTDVPLSDIPADRPVLIAGPTASGKSALAEEIVAAGGGVIVNVGSMMSRQAHGVSPAYVSCKGAMESLTYDLAALYGPAGIRVVTVAPGAIDTAMSRDLLAVDGPERPSEDPIREFSESMAMLGRWGRPEEVAKAIAWVASNPRVSTVITGASKLAQLKENLGALEVLPKLTPEVRERIDAISAPVLA